MSEQRFNPKPKEALGTPEFPSLERVLDKADFDYMWDSQRELCLVVLQCVRNGFTEHQIFNFVTQRYGEGRERLAYRLRTVARYIQANIDQFPTGA